MSKYQMQGLRTADSVLISWLSTTPDWSGAGAGSVVVDVAISSAPGAGPTSIACAITSPAPAATVTQGVPVTITGTISVPGTVSVKLGAAVLGAATVIGLNWSYTWVPLSADVGAQTLNAAAAALVGGATGSASGVAITVATALSPPSAGLTMWFDGRAGAYSDFAGTTPAVAPYGRVARVDQPSPASAGQWKTANETTMRATRDANALDIQAGSTVKFAQPAALSVNAQNCTWGFSFQQRASTSVTNPIYLGNDGASYWGLTVSNTITIWAGSTSVDTGIVVPPGAIAYGFVKYTTSAVAVTVVVNGVTSTYSSAVANANHVTASVEIGSFVSTYWAHATIGQVLAYSNTTVDGTALLAFLAQTAPAGLPLDVPLVAVAGDSISQGVTANTQLSQMYMAQVNLAGTTPIRLLNAGLSNLTLAGLASRWSTEIAPAYSALRRKNILLVQCMTNSMPCSTGTAAATAAAVLAALYAYCDQAKAAGWTVVLFTCLPRADSSAGTGFPTAWATVNADIRANYLAHAHDLADVAAVAGMSLISDAASGPNFSDQLHPNNAGQALLEPAVRAAIQRRLAA